MKTTFENKNEFKEKDFPKLMVSDSGAIVLFIKKGAGISLRKGVIENIFEYRVDWITDNFKDYNGKVTLEND